MHRFFVPPSNIDGGRVTLTPDAARQLARVLRARPGDRITVLDDSGYEYAVSLDSVTARHSTGVVTDRCIGEGEAGLSVTLYQGLMKADRFEYALQKGTEIGISRFVPIISERTVARNVVSASRLTRWGKIMREAAEQAGRCKLPVLKDTLSFTAACDTISKPAIIGWESERDTGIKDTLALIKAEIEDTQSISIMIGSEGGFDDREVAYALRRGVTPISLGRRILRAETAGIIAAAVALYEMGEMG
jgi:16S rRNA (uracil1498-N3)-methyltransferase